MVKKRRKMFESLQHNILKLSPVESGARKTTTGNHQNDGDSAKALRTDIDLLKKVNQDLIEARRAAFNLLEDARETELQLATDLANMRLLRDLAEQLISADEIGEHFREILNTAIIITKADAGTIQMLNYEKQQLEMVTSKGFEKHFINYFEFVDIGTNTIGSITLKTGQRIYLDFDVPAEYDPGGILRMHADQGFLCGHAVPLVAHSGKTIGVLTTHFKKQRRLNERELYFCDLLARQAADMVERKKSEDALRRSQEKLRQLNLSLEKQVADKSEDVLKQHELLKQAEELAQAGSWEYKIKTKEFTWSDGMYTLFNIKKNTPVKPSVYIDFAAGDDAAVAKKIVAAIERTFESLEDVIRIRSKGIEKLLRIKAAPFSNDKGEVEKMLGVDMDITQQEMSEQKITDLNRSLSAMNEDLKVLNAELKSFNTIAANNYAETLRHVYINLETIVTTDARNLSNSSRANIRRAQAAVQKMKLLTNDINNYLELYDVDVKKEMIDPNLILIDVKEKMQKRIEDANATISIAQLPGLYADPKLLSKLMIHILDNAIKFKKPETDPVVVITYSLVAENSMAKAGDSRAYTILTIADNGIGIGEEETDKIFNLFTQLDAGKHKGSGIGLAICKKIMEMHGGFITAEAQHDNGTSIHCYFPSSD
jgi:signal transduction histidine kinase